MDTTAEVLLGHLPVALRALGDRVPSGQATALAVAYRLAALIDAVEGGEGSLKPFAARIGPPTPDRESPQR